MPARDEESALDRAVRHARSSWLPEKKIQEVLRISGGDPEALRRAVSDYND
jgi:hypothetical protein